tara:strand:- start:825 stop:1607 length:783 start_codon:yes stop_codon:yes gene_type:complete
MASPVAGRLNIDDLKSKFLHTAQTNQFFVAFIPPKGVVDYIKEKKGVSWNDMGGQISLLCSEAKLPGSSFATHDVRSDFMGVSEKMAYRRMYDESFSVSMYVDYEYKTLHLFEGWMDYIAGKQATGRGTNNQFKNFRVGSRMNYPNSDDGKSGYRANCIEVVKFDRDMNNNIKYTMIEGFPLSIDPVELAYGQAEIMKLTVNFSFVRYVSEPFHTVLPDTNPQKPIPEKKPEKEKLEEQPLALNFLDRNNVVILNTQNFA